MTVPYLVVYIFSTNLKKISPPPIYMAGAVTGIDFVSICGHSFIFGILRV